MSDLDRIIKHDGDWIHNNGNTYKVLYVANQAADDGRRRDYPLMVVYQGEDGQVWAKTPEGFLHSRTEKPRVCCVCGSTENLYKDGMYGYRCDSEDCACF